MRKDILAKPVLLAACALAAFLLLARLIPDGWTALAGFNPILALLAKFVASR